MKKITKLSSLLLICLSVSKLNSQIVYTDVSPDVVSTMSTSTFFANNIFAIDFNNDNTKEYDFRWDDMNATNWFMHITYNNNQNNALALKGTATNVFGGRFVQPLILNQTIDSSLLWGVSNPEPFIGESTTDANFLDLGDRYVGVRFKIGNNTHYGWILVNFSSTNNTRKITIKSYAYNSTPNGSILAGQTSALNNHDIEKQEVAVYPNPFEDHMYYNFNSQNTTAARYELYNQLGQIVQKDNLGLEQNIIQFKGLNNTGLYNIIFFDSEDAVIAKKKILKFK